MFAKQVNLKILQEITNRRAHIALPVLLGESVLSVVEGAEVHAWIARKVNLKLRMPSNQVGTLSVARAKPALRVR